MGEDPAVNIGDDKLVFVSEPEATPVAVRSALAPSPWKVLVVDDEEEIHTITRLALESYTFENRKVGVLSAFSRREAEQVLEQESDIALVLLDVVMEEDDSGLHLVEYIRKILDNQSVRIVLRTGQPGKAPENEVIASYDINDYKTKPEFTVQKLFTTVTACLRAYHNIETIRRNAQGLEAIIRSSALVFKNQSFGKLGENVLARLMEIFFSSDPSGVNAAFFMGMPNSSIILMAGTGQYRDLQNQSLDEVLPDRVVETVVRYGKQGGESFQAGDYVGSFCSKEGFRSVLYLAGCDALSRLDRKLLRIYANNIAISFDNISLNREIINTQKEVILTLGEIVETRSQETAHHVRRVAEMCYHLARLCRLDEKDCDIIRLASPMHDVGKIGIPEAVLNKPGKLTDSEFEKIKDHARIGYDILRKSNRPIMKAASVIAFQHHERWDGNGYPRGLAGEDIHIFGRITSIVDVFDALSHSRCYKDAWPVDRIVRHMEAESGSHFDPALIQIFLGNLAVFEQINFQFPD